MFTAMLDTESLATLVQLQGFGALLHPEIQQALIKSGQILVEAAQANTWEVFDNPTGVLADSIVFYVTGPEEVAVSVGVPYGHRREYGFVGQIDSLGRVGSDRARPYLIPAMEANESTVLSLIEAATNNALGRVAYG
jgi:hypothetical protein